MPPVALVVDDNPTARDLVRTVLGYRGIESLEADDGTSALEIAREHSLDLLITDIVMPAMDGPALVSHIRALGQTRLPVVFYTASYHRPAAEVVGAMNGARVVYKDGEIDRLLAAIDDALDHEGAATAGTDALAAPVGPEATKRTASQLGEDVRSLAVTNMRLSGLLRMSEAIAHADTLIGVLDAGADAVREALACDVSCVATFAPDGDPDLVATSGLAADARNRIVAAEASWEALWQVAESQSSVLLEGEQLSSTALPPGLPRSAPVLVASFAGAGTRSGIALAASPVGRERFDAHDEQTLVILARQAAVGVDRVHLVAERTRVVARDAVGRLASGIAHEYRDVLVGILGFSELLLPTFHPGDERLAAARGIHDAATRAMTLSGQLLSLNGRQATVPQDVDLGAAIRDYAWLVERIMGEDVETRIQIEPGSMMVRLDPAQLAHVLLTLAMKAHGDMPEGGLLTIDAGIGAGPAGEPRQAILRVVDDGMGMDAGELARLFEPFVTTKGDLSPSGLALASVRAAVEGWGGTIAVDSRVGKGTSITLRIPLVG